MTLRSGDFKSPASHHFRHPGFRRPECNDGANAPFTIQTDSAIHSPNRVTVVEGNSAPRRPVDGVMPRPARAGNSVRGAVSSDRFDASNAGRRMVEVTQCRHTEGRPGLSRTADSGQRAREFAGRATGFAISAAPRLSAQRTGRRQLARGVTARCGLPAVTGPGARRVIHWSTHSASRVPVDGGTSA